MSATINPPPAIPANDPARHTDVPSAVPPVKAAATDATLSTEQKANEKRLEADRKAAEEKAKVLADADEEFHKTVNEAIAKRNKAVEKYVDPSIAGLTEEAWNTTRPAGDPVYAESILPHREKLLTHADSVVRTGLPEVPSDFEKKVSELLATPAYKDLAPQAAKPWGESDAREAAADYEGDEGEKGKLANTKETKSDAKKTDKK